MTRPILILAVVCIASTAAAYQVDMDILVDAICHAESGGQKYRDEPNLSGSHWGRCQVSYWSAVAFANWDRLRSPGDLFVPEVNVDVARKILTDCQRRIWNATAYLLAWCYHEGPDAKPLTNLCRYCRQVASWYMALRLQHRIRVVR